MPEKLIRVPFSDEMVRAILAGRKDVTRRKPNAVWAKAKPGDVIVMTEAFATNCAPADANRGARGLIFYRAGGPLPEWNGGHEAREASDPAFPGRWRPSIHMPAWASRFRAPIVSIRRERLQDITEEDAVREGFAQDHATKCFRIGEDVFQTARFGFEVLIDSLHGAGTWESNPEVFRVEYANPLK